MQGFRGFRGFRGFSGFRGLGCRDWGCRVSRGLGVYGLGFRG